MNSSIDIQRLRQAVDVALRESSRGVAGGWSAGSGKGTVYNGAIFDFGPTNEKWVVVRGPQRPEGAQLLDATAWLKHKEGATHAVALLDPEATVRHQPAAPVFRRKYQAAAWHGLGIVALETEGPGVLVWDPGEAPTSSGDFMDGLAERVREKMEAQRRVNEEWARVVESRKSTAAERLVLPAVASALGDEFEASTPKLREFDAFWRHAKADGLWTRKGSFPESIALEVKVGEDVGAPFCQAFDDLGHYDAVLYVRLLSERTRKDVERLSGVASVKAEAQKKLPLRFIEMDF